jgi:predicted nucleic acid-binding protein
MGAEAFLDTNILLYALVPDRTLPHDPRAEIAEELLARGGVVSVQVLSEFCDVASRKLGKSWSDLSRLLVSIETLCGRALPLTAELHNAAVAISARNRFRIYDSTIVAAAVAAKCAVLYSEDMQHGQVVDGVRIENPFLNPQVP